MDNAEKKLAAQYEELIASVPTRSPIFLPTEKIGLEDRVRGLTRVKKIYDEDLDCKYRPRLRSLREKYKNTDRCFIIGNGPSLNETDLSVLIDEVTFAVNGFFLKSPELNWTPTFYVVEDHLVAEDRHQWIHEFKGPTKLFPAYLAYCLDEEDDTIFFNHRSRVSYPRRFNFSTDAADITYTGCTVTYTCMQLAYYFGFKKIYLIGVDASYDIPKDVDMGDSYNVGVLDMQSDDPNHFHPDYFGKGYRWHEPQADKMVEAYQEAKSALSNGEQTIFNATIGGNLEIFDRVDFSQIFPNALSPEEMRSLREKKAQEIDIQTVCVTDNTFLEQDKINCRRQETTDSGHFKLLIFDISRSGNGTATGEIKRNLLGDWPIDRILQFYSRGDDKLGIYKPETLDEDISIEVALDEIEEYDTDVIIYRPVPDNSKLHNLAMQTIRKSNKPMVTWIMDDWPKRLEREDKQKFRMLDKDFRELLQISNVNLSICKAMSTAFYQRYGVEFFPIANGVDIHQWSRRISNTPAKTSKIVRYAGALASNMTLDSIVRIARVIEKIGARYDISFEIRTGKIWREKSSRYFRKLKRTSFIEEQFHPEKYREWLAEADIVVIAYNFDEQSVEYIKYSMPNKLPECLICGGVTLAHGPSGVAAIDYLESEGCAAVVKIDTEPALEDVLVRLIVDHRYRLDLLEKARDVAIKNHNLIKLRRDLIQYISNAVRDKNDCALINGYGISREARAHIDETDIVAFLMKSPPENSTMIDVGAHYGSALAPFEKMGWNIFAFEPDPENRKHLLGRYGGAENVQIDPRAVGERAEPGVEFYASEVSTGISGMLAFHESHRLVGKVDVTTITDVVATNNIEQVDFLKIDVEGYDFSVLKGIPWGKLKPGIIECEFEDAKTKHLGHTWRDICDFLEEKGYTVYVSEWHPIIRYGIRHDWFGLKRYPCMLEDSNAWGNLLAFKNDPGATAMREAVGEVLKVKHTDKLINNRDHKPTSKLSSNPDLLSKEFGRLASNLSDSSTKNSRPVMKRRLFSRFPSYPGFAEWVRSKNLILFRMGQFTMRVLRFLSRHPMVSTIGLALLVVLILVPIVISELVSYRGYFWASAGLLMFVSVSAMAVSSGIRQIIELAAQLERQGQQQKERIRELDEKYSQLVSKVSEISGGNYQTFNRLLTKSQVDVLLQEWSGKLSLKFTAKSLAYTAHRICMLEGASRGRLATTIEDITLRALVASSVKNKNLRVLEIGTLFGIGLSSIYEHTRSRFSSVHLTAIDPLDGYYGKDARDIVTDESVDERTFRANLAAAGVPEKNFTLIKMMSTEGSAIESASKQLHDVLIIDGDHSYAGIAADFVNYLPAVKRGGYIIFDDYDAPDWPDVKEFVDTTVRNNPNVALVGISWRTAVFRVVKRSATTKSPKIKDFNTTIGKRDSMSQD